MIIDLPPFTESVIVETAKAKGISVAQLLDETFAPDIMINCDEMKPIELSEADAKRLLDDLNDTTPNPTIALKALLKLGEKYA